MADDKQQFSVTPMDGYIYLKTWGAPDFDNLEAPVHAALELSKEKHITKLIDDIRQVDTSSTTIPMQSKAMGILWKLRAFDKVAILFEGDRTRELFFSTLEVLHLGSKFRGFTTEAEAIAWLLEE